MQARSDKFSTVIIRMKIQGEDGPLLHDRAQLFWRTSRLAESESSSARFDVVGNGQWRDRVSISANRRWRGLITQLRLDPCNQPGGNVQIRSIQLE
jgi:hypothetical protein